MGHVGHEEKPRGGRSLVPRLGAGWLLPGALVPGQEQDGALVGAVSWRQSSEERCGAVLKEARWPAPRRGRTGLQLL